MSAIQTHRILHRKHSQARHRMARRTHHAPMNCVAVTVQITASKAPFAVASNLPPAFGSVVVMGAAVGHRCWRVVMWQKLVIAVAAKRKLQNAHTRKTAGIAQSDHIGRDEA